ncbi:MAG: zf-HC2 domain-containing protein [Myxococcaceae bacterium]|nr:MAG: zf-HC2 domain-containing protein [Myxococcaceae bacterium]
MGACVEYEEQASLHAAGALEGEEATRFQSHLESCAACQAEVASAREVLGLVTLPPPTAIEVRAQEGLGGRTLAAWRREQTRRWMGRRALGSLAAVAAVVTLMLGPSALERLKSSRAGTGTTGAAVPLAVGTGDDVDAETMAAFEAWAGLDPLDSDALASISDGDDDWMDGDDDFDDLGEAL